MISPTVKKPSNSAPITPNVTICLRSTFEARLSIDCGEEATEEATFEMADG
jgi:hypothetical protein